MKARLVVLYTSPHLCPRPRWEHRLKDSVKERLGFLIDECSVGRKIMNESKMKRCVLLEAVEKFGLRRHRRVGDRTKEGPVDLDEKP